MTRFLIRRLLLTVPVLFGVATLVFSLIHLVPGDPVQVMLGESASPADVAEMRGRLGLDRPLVVQYAAFLKGVVTADLGTSLRTSQPVTATILERMPATVELAAAAMLVAILVAMPLGVVAAVRAGTADRSRRHDAGAAGHLDAELLAGAAARDRVLRLAGLVAGLGPRNAWPISCCPRSRSGRRSRPC